MDAAAGEVLIETPGVRVTRSAQPSATMVVTFSNYVDGGAGGEAFGASFLARHAIDAVHVIARGNHWFQLAEMPEVLVAIRAAAAGKRVLTYGSSMGGYAAIRFADALGADQAIAISPQYALDRRLVPFERRWRHEARRIRFGAPPGTIAVAPAILFFDPRNPDAGHAAAWSRERAIVPVPLSHAGHPATTFLAQSGLLGESLLAIVAGRFDAAATVREAHARRRRSAQYLARLAIAQPGWRRRCALALAARAASAAPSAPDYLGLHAVLLYRSGDPAAAEQAHRAALALVPEDPIALFRLSRFLQRIGRYDEADAFAAAAVHADPGSAALSAHRRAVLNARRSPPNPLRSWARTINRLRHLHNRIGWRRGWRAWDRLARP